MELECTVCKEDKSQESPQKEPLTKLLSIEEEMSPENKDKERWVLFWTPSPHLINSYKTCETRKEGFGE